MAYKKRRKIFRQELHIGRIKKWHIKNVEKYSVRNYILVAIKKWYIKKRRKIFRQELHIGRFMANTYTQIHIHFVFAVKFRQALISKEWKEELYQYIAGIIKNNNHKLLAINGVSDHVHILIGIRPAQSISDLMKNIKQDSSKWINKNKISKGCFQWQEGYGAFSYSKSQLAAVVNYIKNQELHHRKQTLREEYLDFLKKFEVDYDEKFIFKELM